MKSAMRLRSMGALGTLLMISMPCRVGAYEAISLRISPPTTVIYGPNADDYFGAALRSGPEVADVSGDGIPDLVGSAVQAQGPHGLIGSGAVYVVFGPISGIRDLATSPPDVTYYGCCVGGWLGNDVVLDDLDEDGATDLIIGQYTSNRSGGDAGEIDVFFGPIAPGVRDLTVEEPDFVVFGRPGDALGESIAIADASGDGIKDIVAGTPARSVGIGTYEGGGVVINGPFTRGATRNLGVLPPELDIVGTQRDGNLGELVAAGDVSGDGIADVVLTSPTGSGFGGEVNAGRVVVVFGGRASGTVVDLAVTTPDVDFRGGQANSSAGDGIAIGDVTGEGTGDLLVVVPGTRLGSRSELDVLLGPISPGNVDQVTRTADVVFASQTTYFAQGVSTSSWSSGPRILLSALSTLPGTCPAGTGQRVLDVIPPAGTVVDLDVDRASLEVGGRGTWSARLVDLDVDGEPELIMDDPVDGPLGDRPNAGSVIVVPKVDRCEGTPPPAGPTELRVTRSADDVLLHFDEAGLGEDSVAADIFRGLIPDRRDRPFYSDDPYSCRHLTSPAVDVGAAAPSAPDVYYLLTHGCPDACNHYRLRASLGTSSTGVPRPMDPGYSEFDCP